MLFKSLHLSNCVVLRQSTKKLNLLNTELSGAFLQIAIMCERKERMFCCVTATCWERECQMKASNSDVIRGMVWSCFLICTEAFDHLHWQLPQKCNKLTARAKDTQVLTGQVLWNESIGLNSLERYAHVLSWVFWAFNVEAFGYQI